VKGKFRGRKGLVCLRNRKGAPVAKGPGETWRTGPESTAEVGGARHAEFIGHHENLELGSRRS
jgi:hypothetical protein